MEARKRPLLSIVTPVYNEKDNLPVLYERISKALDSVGIDWEWVAIDDHSADSSFEVLRSLAEKDERVRAYRLARNSGSHIALLCGLEASRGHSAVIMASDLQDPPEALPKLLDKWREGVQIVWAVREAREGESAGTLGFARFYYWLMRVFVGVSVPATGADFVLLDERVVEALRVCKETNVSLFILLMWLGFRQDQVFYTKEARLHGESGWTLEKKLKLVIDSITAFTYRPLRLMGYMGFGVACCGFLYALIIVINSLLGTPVQGWSSIMVAILVLGGLQMIMLGILGEYLWRTLDEARHRPRFIIEDEIGFAGRGQEKCSKDVNTSSQEERGSSDQPSPISSSPKVQEKSSSSITSCEDGEKT